MVFTNSITQQPSFSRKKKLTRYAKITTAILNEIGHEDVNEFCAKPSQGETLEELKVNITDAIQLMLASIYEEAHEKKMEIEVSE